MENQETTVAAINVARSGAIGCRVESSQASAYRLARRNGELILQGAFHYMEPAGPGNPHGLAGWKWRDIPIVDLDANPQD